MVSSSNINVRMFHVLVAWRVMNEVGFCLEKPRSMTNREEKASGLG